MLQGRWNTQSGMTTRARGHRPWILWLFTLIGLGMLGAATYIAIDTRNFVATAASAPGEVIDLIESRDSDDDTVYRPRVRFQSPDGRSHEFTGSVGSNPAGFYVGEAVDVLFDPARPSDAQINTMFQLWFTPLLLGGMGAAFTFLSLLGFFGGVRMSHGETTAPPVDPAPSPESADPPSSAASPDRESGSSDRSVVVDRRARD